MIPALLFAAAVVFTDADADFALSCASNFVSECAVRDAGSVRGHMAADWILRTTSRHGVDMRSDLFVAPAASGGRVRDRAFVNVYAKFESSPSAPWVVMVSHFDTKPDSGCPGANDGASTTGLLMALAAAIANRGYDGSANVMLVWTDGEECVESYGEHDGLWGSRRAAAEFKRRGMEVRAVVCLDMLGDRNLGITVPANSSDTLSRIACLAAKRAGLGSRLVRRADESVLDDHVPFLEAGFSAVDLIDFEYGSAPGRNDWWHTPEDTMDKLSRDSLLKSGRLAAELINILAK